MDRLVAVIDDKDTIDVVKIVKDRGLAHLYNKATKLVDLTENAMGDIGDDAQLYLYALERANKTDLREAIA